MKGDFLGFSFDGIHCSRLGITHVSSSDRYSEELFPEVKDKTIEIPNNHGEYYYGSTYGTRTFEIEFAYDSITETQFRNIRRLFGTRKICELIFDERPYKVYYAKIESPIEMSYVCFDEEEKVVDTEGQPGLRVVNRTYSTSEETKTVNFTVPAQSTYIYTLPDGAHADDVVILPEEIAYTVEGLTYTFTNEAPEPLDGSITFIQDIATSDITRETIYPWIHTGKKQRIYKGEGTINLICYQPFAHQLFKIKELYAEAGIQKGNLVTTYTNVDEWIESSGILDREEYNARKIDQVVSATGPYTYAIPVYNPGDLDVGFCLYIPFTQVTTEVDGQDPVITYEILPKDGKSDIIINGDSEVLVLNKIKRKDSRETGIIINTRTHLIEGVIFSTIANTNDYRRKAWQTTGTLYNEYIKIGEFPYIKRNDWQFDDTQYSQAIYISCKDNSNGNENFDSGIRIYYDYLYF